MVGLVFHNFCSSAVGIAIAAAVVRGFARQNAATLGNFWVDMVRIIGYLLLPVCTIFAIFLISQGVVENFKPFDSASLADPFTTQVPKVDDKSNPILFTIQVPKVDDQNKPVVDDQGKPVMVDAQIPAVMDQKIDTQTIAQGPCASEAAIKMFGLNGDSYFNANAAHPLENPDTLSASISSRCCVLFSIRRRDGLLLRQAGEQYPARLGHLGDDGGGGHCCGPGPLVGGGRRQPDSPDGGNRPASGNMEGKEVRLGIMNSSLFASNTTNAACGAINCQHDSLTPIGGLVTLFNIHLGEIIYGGVGSGLYGMLVYIAVTVFICGLMVGRTLAGYLGKRFPPMKSRWLRS